MQAENGRRTALAALCALALGACEARQDQQDSPVDSIALDAPALPAASDASSAPVEDDLPDAIVAEEPVAPPDPAPVREKRRGVPVTAVAEPQEPPVEVEGLVITGPRDGETLGEYRARADRAFRRLDTDDDRQLDREEITSGVGRLSLRTALEQSDLDLDDRVSRQEFDDLTTRAFQRLDSDGDGVITESEMQAGDPLAPD